MKRHKVQVNNPLSKSGFLTIQSNPKSSKRVHEAHNFVRNQKLKLCIKLKNEMFGFEEIFEKKNRRIYSCECASSHGELWAISILEFNKRVRPYDSLFFFRRRTLLLAEWAERRLEKLKKVEVSKVKNQFGMSHIFSPVKIQIEEANDKRVRIFRQIPATKPSSTFRHRSEKNINKKRFAFTLFDTEVPVPKESTFKEPSLEYTRKLIADFKPPKYPYMRYSSVKGIRNKSSKMYDL